jgi:endogenous inhibitor of DNA gyrase (YacG/DUF329 family)
MMRKAESKRENRENQNGPSGARCPICGKHRADDYRPFCSKRCADVDLGRWLSESYAIPLPENETSESSDGDKS